MLFILTDLKCCQPDDIITHPTTTQTWVELSTELQDL